MKLDVDAVYQDIWSQARGLMFSKKKTLFFDFGKEKKTPLHNWFVFFDLYVYYLDENYSVVEQGHMRPFGWYNPKSLARYIVESPTDLKVKNGSRLQIRKTL